MNAAGFWKAVNRQIAQSCDCLLCREQKNPKKVVLFADSHDTLFIGNACPSSEQYAQAYWNHGADLIFQADGVNQLSTSDRPGGVQL